MIEPEARHRACWYSRRTPDILPHIGFHTIEDAQLLFCVHPMWFPVVGYQSMSETAPRATTSGR